VEAAQRFLEAKERYPVGSEGWAQATAWAFDTLSQEVCAEVAKPEWWNDEGLKALSARVVRAAPNDERANSMPAALLCGARGAWEVGPRLAAEIMEAAVHWDRSAALALLRQRKPGTPVGRTGAAARQLPCNRENVMESVVFL